MSAENECLIDGLVERADLRAEGASRGGRRMSGQAAEENGYCLLCLTTVFWGRLSNEVGSAYARRDPEGHEGSLAWKVCPYGDKPLMFTDDGTLHPRYPYFEVFQRLLNLRR